MPLKPLAKFWKHTSQKGATYYRFTLRDPLPAGSKLLLFRRDDSGDDSAGNVCLAVDGEQHDQRTPSQTVANHGGQHRSPPTPDDRDDPGGFKAEAAQLAANPPPVDVPF